jgi:hypothetical protein
MSSLQAGTCADGRLARRQQPAFVAGCLCGLMSANASQGPETKPAFWMGKNSANDEPVSMFCNELIECGQGHAPATYGLEVYPIALDVVP